MNYYEIIKRNKAKKRKQKELERKQAIEEYLHMERSTTKVDKIYNLNSVDVINRRKSI